MPSKRKRAKREADPRLISESCELRVGEHGLVTSLIEKPMRPRGAVKGCGFYALQPEICDYIARTPRTALRDEYEFTLTLDLFVRDGKDASSPMVQGGTAAIA